MVGLVVIFFVLAAVFAVLGIVNPERLARTHDGGTSSFFRVFAFIMAAIMIYQGFSTLIDL
ncbi:hypothetical protein [Streptomyces niger]|uniref:hypothetical protein n=1 Tax=Streptomyces niger TaxID=66373 RepID=UPI000699F3B3|nr:hypothetical protein [Streptomyces niger]